MNTVMGGMRSYLSYGVCVPVLVCVVGQIDWCGYKTFFG